MLLKLSGEALMGEQEFGIESEAIATYAKQIKEVYDMAELRPLKLATTPLLSAVRHPTAPPFHSIDRVMSAAS